MDVYDHYRWRFTLKTTHIKNAFSGLDPTPQWQDKYYAANSIARRESLLWTGQLPPLPDAPATAVPMKAATATIGLKKGRTTKGGAKSAKTPAKNAKKARPAQKSAAAKA